MLVFCWEFLHLCSSVILASNFLLLLLFCFFVVSLSGFSIWVMVASLNEFESFHSSEIFWNVSKRKGLLQIVDKIYLWSHQVWDFCLLLNTFSISVLVFHLFIFSISPWFSLWRLYLSNNYPFLLCWPFYWHTLAHSSLMILCISVESVVTSF